MSAPGPWVWLIVGLVAVQRLAEMFHARRNTLCLLAEGGVESGAGHYPLIVGLHVAWLASMLIHVASDTPVHWPFLFAYLILQGFRAWVLVSLGRFWTTRIITVAGLPLVRRGPYRFFRHPNYMVVATEIAVLPLVFGAWEIALVYSVLNGAMMVHRIRVENQALSASPGYSEIP